MVLNWFYTARRTLSRRGSVGSFVAMQGFLWGLEHFVAEVLLRCQYMKERDSEVVKKTKFLCDSSVV